MDILSACLSSNLRRRGRCRQEATALGDDDERCLEAWRDYFGR